MTNSRFTFKVNAFLSSCNQLNESIMERPRKRRADQKITNKLERLTRRLENLNRTIHEKETAAS